MEAFVEPRSLPPGTSEITLLFHDPQSGREAPMKVLAYFPKSVDTGKPTDVLFVMHGVKRDAEAEFRRIIPLGSSRNTHSLLPETHNFVLLIPEFSNVLFPHRNAYNFGGMFEDEDPARPRARERWAFSAIESIFHAVESAAKLRTSGFHLFGHSAGAQFVHRYVAFANSSARACGAACPHRLVRAIAANAGSYTLPSFHERFPFGFGGLEARVSAHDLAAFVSAPLTVLLGELDTDPQHKHLPQDEAANRQGAHRVARGDHFFHSGQTCAATIGVPFGWTRHIVPGIGHSGTRMLQAHVKHLFPAESPGSSSHSISNNIASTHTTSHTTSTHITSAMAQSGGTVGVSRVVTLGKL